MKHKAEVVTSPQPEKAPHPRLSCRPIMIESSTRLLITVGLAYQILKGCEPHSCTGYVPYHAYEKSRHYRMAGMYHDELWNACMPS